MAATYLDLLAKMQEQGLDVLKQAQKAHIDALTAAREAVEKLPTLPQMPAMPTIEGLPTIAELTALGNSFVSNVADQQKSYAAQLAEVFAPIKKNAP